MPDMCQSVPGAPLATSRRVTVVAQIIALAVLVVGASPGISAQMDLSQAAGVPLPASDLPAGTVSVRVVRGSFSNNLAGETVVFTVDGQERSVVTDASGRAQVEGLANGSRVRASATVANERLDTQEVVVGNTGLRFVLVASEAGPARSGMPAAPGSVFLGPDSRIVFDYSNELLNVYYVVHVVNSGQSAVDLGGPLVIDLPTEARSATAMDGMTPQASVSGARVTVRGPFAPGRTDVNVAFTLPFSGDTARLEQRWPTDAQPFTVFALKTADMDLVSPQLEDKQNTAQDGQPLVVGRAPALGPGEVFVLEISGLPHRPVWPRNLAFGAASVICIVGLWAAFGPMSRRKYA